MEKVRIEEIKELVLNYIRKEYIEEEGSEITGETKLISSGLIDSFSMVSLLVFLERKFSIKIPPSKATPEAFDSVNNILDLLCQYLEE